MKYEWRKQEKEYYLPSQKPALVSVPNQKFIMIRGKGNPNTLEFQEKIAVLYSIAYTIRMMPKNGFSPEGYFEYTVYPLEGLWDLSEVGRKSTSLIKDELIYTLMIRQPEFVTQDLFDKALANVKVKKPNPLLDEISFEPLEDGLSVQILHIGPYDDEPKSFEAMKDFISQNNLEIISLVHREIYLSDPRKVGPAKMKTVLRYRVQRMT